MRKTLLSAFSFFSAIVVFMACDKTTTEDFPTESTSDYTIPLQKGKYIIYRLDSTVFTNFGRTTEVHRYQVKHLVDTSFIDGTGRKSYRVYRYLNDSLASGPWLSNGTYYITVVNDAQVEVVEENLRFIKLHGPMRDGFTWRGNSYLGTDAYDGLYAFNNFDNNINQWNYFYDGDQAASETINGKTYTNVFTVEQVNVNDPVDSIGDVGQRAYWVEKYSKNTGMVYRETMLWDQQPNPTLISPGPPPVYQYDPYKLGYGVKMWMISHN